MGEVSTGWYFGFKLHLIVSDTGELLGAKSTSGNTDDRSVLEEMCSELFGKLFGDRGYISKEKAEMFYEKYGVELITTIKKNMKKKPISLLNKILIRYGEFSVRIGGLYVPKKEAILWYTSHWAGATGCISYPSYVEFRSTRHDLAKSYS